MAINLAALAASQAGQKLGGIIGTKLEIPGLDFAGNAIGSVLGGIFGGSFGGFGGKGHHKVSLPDFTVPSNTPSILDTPARLRSFRGSGGEGGVLTGQKRSVHEVFWPTKTELEHNLRAARVPSEQVGELTDAIRDKFEEFSSPVASSPADSVNKNQALANIASYVVDLNEQAKTRLQFLRDNPTLHNRLTAEMRANPVTSLDSYNNLFGFIQNADKDTLINFESQIEDPNANLGDVFSGAWAGVGPGTDIGPGQDFGPQLPDDFIPDDGGGSDVQDPFSQESIDYFNQQEEALDELITQQQQDKALQGDNDATSDIKKQSALALLGLTSSFLINSLTNPDSQKRVSQQRNTALGGSGGSVLSSSGPLLERKANVFKSGIFQPIKQEDFVRPDAPLTVIPESPSSFPLLAEQGQRGLLAQGLRRQNKGLVN